MPIKTNLAYLFDIKMCIERIDTFLEDVDTFDQYVDDQKTSSAVERQLSIIGEAVIQYTKTDSLENAAKIRGFRNRLIHAYDSIDPTTVWAIVKIHLPKLLNEVNQKLSK